MSEQPEKDKQDFDNLREGLHENVGRAKEMQKIRKNNLPGMLKKDIKSKGYDNHIVI